MRIVLLAVTKTYTEYCLAGMTYEGVWVRPMPPRGRFWENIEYEDHTFFQVGDIWEINEYEEELDHSSPGHTENIRIPSYECVSRVERLTNQELTHFLLEHVEDAHALHDTMEANGRSICLIEIDSFEQVEDYTRLLFEYEGEKIHNITRREGFPVTDLKWRSVLKRSLDSPDLYDSLFLCVGLSRREPHKDIHREYPMVISIMTDPEVPIPHTYPN